ncbi:type I methionyl aminopeptidase [bacterium]|jgi:methionyl aminopeptidase|nr:type I methionyl aminopeptidase [bacterium]MBT3903965.1 type I methionyl aminopeptidase [bacterium]MBT4577795.1 type I methionyl aminopeptidase [bacterium]MBT5346094.1 type I methionyl aminopeptidase [bacterium]MBT6131363.1 type I methionyl aminopeptidase [bacterium]
MITIKNKIAIKKMETAGSKLESILLKLNKHVVPGASTHDIDLWIEEQLRERGLDTRMKGYRGYQHVSCISVNDMVVHGVPSGSTILRNTDFVTIDVCASFKGYCADMARQFFVGQVDQKTKDLARVAQEALDAGISCAVPGNRLGDISSAIQQVIESNGYGVVRDFAGHGLGKRMHEDPEILNYGIPGTGPILRDGMTFAIEPMITMGDYKVFIDKDGWTVKTVDGSRAAHVEDTILISNQGPRILTRSNL